MSWTVTSWAKNGGQYSDRLIAPETMETPYDDFTGRACIYQSIEASQPFPVDMIVESVDFNFDEHTQVSPHIGNTFSFIAFGKNGMQLRVNGVIVDTGDNFGKDTFMDIYRNYLRLEAVSRRGVAPIFCFPNAAMYCAASSVHLTETADSEDLVFFTLTLEVIKAVFKNDERNFMLSYVHGTEMSESTVLGNTTSTSSSTSSLTSTTSSLTSTVTSATSTATSTATTTATTTATSTATTASTTAATSTAATVVTKTT